MNPLTQIKNTQKATRAEIELGIGDKSSWHSRFKHSAYVFTGGLPFELTEGDLLAVFSQYGEIVDVHLVRDKQTGKSKGFAFLAYEDQRSTVLAVDNLSGARVAGRTIRVEHVDNYRKKRAEMEGEPIPEDSDEEKGEAEDAGRAMEVGRRGDSSGAAPAGGVPAEERRAGREGGGDAPWGGGNSMFALLAQAKAEGLVKQPWKTGEGGGGRGIAVAAGGGGEEEQGRGREKKGKKDKKDKKDRKKEKKEKKHRHRSRSKSRERSRSRSRDRGRKDPLRTISGRTGSEREEERRGNEERRRRGDSPRDRRRNSRSRSRSRERRDRR